MSTTKEEIAIQEAAAEQSGAAAEMTAKKMGFGSISKQLGAWVKKVVGKKQKEAKAEAGAAHADGTAPADGAPAENGSAPIEGAPAATPATAVQT
jgi:hypothetical protein